MKKTLSALVLSCFLLASVSAGDEYEAKDYNNGYKDVVIDESLDFSAKRDGHMIYMNWKSYQGSDFEYYKIMRSVTNSNPVYPDQHAMKYLDNKDISELKVGNWSDDDAYYRICVITLEQDRYCSNVVKLEGYEKPEKEYHDDKYEDKKEYDYKKNDTYKKEYEKKSYDYEKIKKEKLEQKKYEYKKQYQNKKTNQSGLSYKMQKRANEIIEKFIKKVDEKYDSNEDKVKIIKKVMERLEKVGEEKEKYKALTSYMVKKLQYHLDKYDDDFEDIENIFNDL